MWKRECDLVVWRASKKCAHGVISNKYGVVNEFLLLTIGDIHAEVTKLAQKFVADQKGEWEEVFGGIAWNDGDDYDDDEGWLSVEASCSPEVLLNRTATLYADWEFPAKGDDQSDYYFPVRTSVAWTRRGEYVGELKFACQGPYVDRRVTVIGQDLLRERDIRLSLAAGLTPHVGKNSILSLQIYGDSFHITNNYYSQWVVRRTKDLLGWEVDNI